MNKPLRLLAILALSFFIAGLFEPLSPKPGEPLSPAGAVHGVAVIFLLYAWCKADSAQWGITPPPGAALLCAFLLPIGLPYYLFRSRPWRRALAGMAMAAAFFVLAIALFNAGFLLKYHFVA